MSRDRRAVSLRRALDKLATLSPPRLEVGEGIHLLDWFKKSDPQFDQRKAAAVCVLFHGETFERSRVLLTLRSDRVATHAGQVAFPGGAVEDQDQEDPIRAAIRECQEEVGLGQDWLRVHGSLEVFPTLGGNFLVRPVLASVALDGQSAGDDSGALPELKFQVDEVVDAEWVSVKTLLESREFETRSVFGRNVNAPVFWWGSRRMWGLSAWIFHSILIRYANLKA